MSAGTLETFKDWVAQGKLKAATLSAEGLSLDGTVLQNQKLSIESNGKILEYTLASIYLQIIDPNQKLVAYRKACKEHSVNDPVSSLDKDTIVGYFGAPAPAAAASTEASAKESETANEETTEKVEKETAKKTDKGDDSRRHKSSKTSSSRHKDRKRSSSGKDRRADKSAKKKKPTEVTNEELFSNLGAVVEKRITDLDATKEEITKALSADGFEFNQEILDKYRDAAHQIFENEIPVGNSASILRAANPRKDLSRVLQIFNETVNPKKTSKSKSSSGSMPMGRLAHKMPHLIGKTPVIVVPKGMTAPITLINALDFFANGQFIPRDVAMKQGRALRTNQKITFKRQVRTTSSSGVVEYEIIDNPKKLGTSMKEWDRIVAVVALGQSWQFKDWYMEYSNPVQLFARTYGFFLTMEGDRIPQEVGSWKVRQAKLNRDKRGLDSVTFASFWNGLDEWMSVHRRELLPQTQDN